MLKAVWRWIVELDRVLRGETTRMAAIRQGTIAIPLRGLSVVILVLGMIYGLCMGSFSLFRAEGSHLQIVASTLKVPLLFFLTLLVTFPSLYVFNALVGSRLSFLAVLRLLIAALGVNLAVLASLGPIVAFFSVSTTSYEFMVLLNVVIFAVSGALGLAFLLQTLNRLSLVDRELRPQPTADEAMPQQSIASQTMVTSTDTANPSASNAAEQPTELTPLPETGASATYEPGALDRLEGQMLGRHVKKVFGTWIIVFGLVGSQMGWVLRPFIGDPNAPFQWFRQRESNFFEAIADTLRRLLVG
jgi:hypothetical protein